MRATHCVLVFTGLLLAATQLEASPITINVDAFTSMPVVVAEKSNGARGLKNWLDMFESATIPFGSSGGGSGALYSSGDFGRSLMGVGPGFNMRSVRRPWVVVSGGGAHFTGPDISRHHSNHRTRPGDWVVTLPEVGGAGGTGQFSGSVGSGGTGAAGGAGGSAIGGGGGTVTTASAVPEPGSMVLLGSGLIAGIGALRRRARKA